MAHKSTIGQLVAMMKRQLEGSFECRELNSVVDLILEDYLGQSRVTFRSHPDQPVTGDVVACVKKAISRLKQHVPVQYILGKASFYGLEFIVNEHVLIPRPETGELVGWILSDYRAGAYPRSSKILDIGTGSGCIAITLKRNIPDSVVVAVDISRNALEIAQLNAQALETEIQFLQMDILDPDQCDVTGPFDLIVSNPPYVLQSDKAWMDANVLDHEPSVALYVEGERPLIFTEAIASFAARNLSPAGAIYLEINEKMGSRILELFSDAGYEQTVLKRDIHDKIRMVRARGRV